MESSLRLEVQELMQACNHLIGSAHENNGALTNEESEMVVAYIHTLQTNFLPHQADMDDPPLASTLSNFPPID